MATVKIEFQPTPHLVNAVTNFQDPQNFTHRDKYQIQKRYQKEESLRFPKRAQPVRVHKPKFDDDEDEFYLEIYEDDADCPDLTDSEDDLDYADNDDDDDDDDNDNDNAGVIIHEIINKLKEQTITDMNVDLNTNLDVPALIDAGKMTNGVVTDVFGNDIDDVRQDKPTLKSADHESRVHQDLTDMTMDIEENNNTNSNLMNNSEEHAVENDNVHADYKSKLDNKEETEDTLDADDVTAHQDDLTEFKDPGEAINEVCTSGQKDELEDDNIVDDDDDDDDNVAGKDGVMDVSDGRRRKVNTPASVFTELGPSRNASRLESREKVYRQALRLLSNRCKSRNLPSGMDSAFGDTFYGVNAPEMVYIDQQKPTPMPPLKAWRGYNGNIYFAPIQVDKCTCPQSEFAFPNEFQTSFQKRNKSQCRSEYTTSKTPLSQQQGECSPSPKTPRHGSKQSNTASSYGNLSASSKSCLSERKMAVLDKRSVINRFNQNIEEDLCWIEGQEHTGTLAVVVPVRNTNKSKGTRSYDKERLYKGSVVHKLNTVNYSSNNTAMAKMSSKHAKTDPFLLIRGDKFAPPTVMSPLLRTQTQYSQSTQRTTNNSPDLHRTGFDKLPPLEQLRASLRFPDHNLPNPYGAMATYSRSKVYNESYKPFIKYSPELTNQRRIPYS